MQQTLLVPCPYPEVVFQRTLLALLMAFLSPKGGSAAVHGGLSVLLMNQHVRVCWCEVVYKHPSSLTLQVRELEGMCLTPFPSTSFQD